MSVSPFSTSNLAVIHLFSYSWYTVILKKNLFVIALEKICVKVFQLVEGSHFILNNSKD